MMDQDHYIMSTVKGEQGETKLQIMRKQIRFLQELRTPSVNNVLGLKKGDWKGGNGNKGKQAIKRHQTILNLDPVQLAPGISTGDTTGDKPPKHDGSGSLHH